MVEQRSPKPQVACSSRVSPAIYEKHPALCQMLFFLPSLVYNGARER